VAGLVDACEGVTTALLDDAVDLIVRSGDVLETCGGEARSLDCLGHLQAPEPVAVVVSVTVVGQDIDAPVVDKVLERVDDTELPCVVAGGAKGVRDGAGAEGRRGVGEI